MINPAGPAGRGFPSALLGPHFMTFVLRFLSVAIESRTPLTVLLQISNHK